MNKLRASTYSYCSNLVRKYDYENYLCSLLLPQPGQHFAIGLRALNVELAQINNRTKNISQAKHRFEFWRTIIDRLFDNTDLTTIHNLPIEMQLKQSIIGMNLTKSYFHQLIDAREQHFGQVSFQSVQEAEQYFDNIFVPIHNLLAEAYGLQTFSLASIFNSLGRAQGFIYMLRSSVLLAQHNHSVTFPQDLLKQYNLTQEDIVSNLNSYKNNKMKNENLQLLIYNLTSLTHEYATNVNKLGNKLIQQTNDQPKFNSIKLNQIELKHQQLLHIVLPKLLLPLVCITNYINNLAYKCDFDLIKQSYKLKFLTGLLPISLSWTSWRNKIPNGPKP